MTVREYIVLKKIKSSTTDKLDKSERLMKGVDLWASYWRYYPHTFVKYVMNINLKVFQIILLYMMENYPYFMMIAARGIGKTFITAIYICYRAVCYPGSEIIIAAGVLSQAIEVIEKIDTIVKDAPLLAREIEPKGLSTSVNNARVDFINGSTVRVVTASHNSRSKRANVIIVDEFRMVEKNIIDTVLRRPRIICAIKIM